MRNPVKVHLPLQHENLSLAHLCVTHDDEKVEKSRKKVSVGPLESHFQSPIHTRGSRTTKKMKHRKKKLCNAEFNALSMLCVSQKFHVVFFFGKTQFYITREWVPPTALLMIIWKSVPEIAHSRIGMWEWIHTHSDIM